MSSKFNECQSAEDYLTFLDNDDRGLRHTHYYHYTSIKNIDKILTDGQLRLTSLSKSANDNIEKKWYEENGQNLFSLCFSTGTSENLPLWYLYSGIDGKGACLGLKKKSFHQLVDKPKLYLAMTEKQKPYNILGTPTLLQEEEYKLVVRDILYIGKDSSKKDSFRAKYNNQTNNDISSNVQKELVDKYSRFIKGLIWFYEKETRVQVEITNKQLIDSQNNYIVLLSIEPILDDITITLAPEYETTHTQELLTYQGITKYLLKQIHQSDYAGQIEMNLKSRLCETCSKNQANK